MKYHTLQMVDRRGRNQTLARDDVHEVRLDHRLSVGQHVGLGMPLGGVTGWFVGKAADCDCDLRGLAPVADGGLGTFWDGRGEG